MNITNLNRFGTIEGKTFTLRNYYKTGLKTGNLKNTRKTSFPSNY